MSETILGSSRWDNLKQVTYWARLSCQNDAKIDDIDIANYHDFLIEKQKNPVTANIAMQSSIRNSNADRRLMGCNIKELERAPENDYLVKSIRANYQKNYPNSGGLRNLLIGNDRFSLDFVKPKMTNKFQKLLIKLKSFL